jgi:hypothetical protein
MTLKRSELTLETGLKLYDEPARKLAKIVVPKVSEIITYVKDHPNQYSIDLIGYNEKDEPVAYIEVECSHSWKQESFPWPCLSYLEERKGRYLYKKEYQDLDMYFVMFNLNFTSFAITRREYILQSRIVTSNRSWKGTEKFRMINKDKFKWFKINEI